MYLCHMMNLIPKDMRFLGNNKARLVKFGTLCQKGGFHPPMLISFQDNEFTMSITNFISLRKR